MSDDKATPRPWKATFVRWTKDDPIMGFVIRPADPQVLAAKRGVSIAALNCAEPAISAEAMYPNGEIEANAQLICDAVNAYARDAEIREALAEVQKRHKTQAQVVNFDDCGCDYCEALSRINK